MTIRSLAAGRSPEAPAAEVNTYGTATATPAVFKKSRREDFWILLMGTKPRDGEPVIRNSQRRHASRDVLTTRHASNSARQVLVNREFCRRFESIRRAGDDRLSAPDRFFGGRGTARQVRRRFEAFSSRSQIKTIFCGESNCEHALAAKKAGRDAFSTHLSQAGCTSEMAKTLSATFRFLCIRYLNGRSCPALLRDRLGPPVGSISEI